MRGLAEPDWVPYLCECMEAAAKERVLVPESEKAAALERGKKAVSIGRKFFNATFESYIAKLPEQKEALDLVRGFTENFNKALDIGQWLLLIGNVGTGKTHLAVAAMNEVMRKGHTARYIKVRRLIQLIKDNWTTRTQAESVLLKPFVDADLLVLDEIGVQFASKTEQDILYDLLDGRYEEKKPVIITTNLDYDRFSEVVGVRILDRVLDGACDSRVVVFTWESYRNGQK